MEQKRQQAAETRRQERLKIEACRKEREARHREFMEAKNVKIQQEEEERRSRMKQLEWAKREEEAQKAVERAKVMFCVYVVKSDVDLHLYA